MEAPVTTGPGTAVLETETAPEETLPPPPLGDVSYADAEAAFQEGDYELATRLFTVYTEQHPGNAWGRFMLGMSTWRSGEMEAGETAFRSALDLDPNHLKSRLNLTRLLLEEGRYRNALAEAEEAVETNPRSGEAHRLLGRAHHNLGDGPAAESAYREALALDRDDVWALNNLGLLLIERERFEEAVAPLARASLLESEVGFIQNNLGIALERSGHPTQAADAYRAALEVDDTNRKALDNLDRVLRVPEDPSETALDLAALAEGFQPMLAEQVEVDSTGGGTADLGAVEP
jgi:superkiller protein 3